LQRHALTKSSIKCHRDKHLIRLFLYFSYLTEMWNHTRKKPRTFSADSMPALKVRVPKQQGNTSECGIFVLLYAENFLKVG